MSFSPFILFISYSVAVQAAEKPKALFHAHREERQWRGKIPSHAQ